MGPYRLWKPAFASDLAPLVQICQQASVKKQCVLSHVLTMRWQQHNVMSFLGPIWKTWSSATAFHGSTLPLQASFWIRFGPIASNLPTSVSQKEVCGVPSHVNHEVAVAQCHVILRTHMGDMEQCNSISWVHSIAFGLWEPAFGSDLAPLFQICQQASVKKQCAVCQAMWAIRWQ
jgi:hypothetical protein